MQVHGCSGRLIMTEPSSAVGRWPTRHPSAVDLCDKQWQRSQQCAAMAVADVPMLLDKGLQEGRPTPFLLINDIDICSKPVLCCARPCSAQKVQQDHHTGCITCRSAGTPGTLSTTMCTWCGCS